MHALPLSYICRVPSRRSRGNRTLVDTDISRTPPTRECCESHADKELNLAAWSWKPSPSQTSAQEEAVQVAGIEPAASSTLMITITLSAR